MELRRIDAFLTFKNRRNLELQALGAFRAFNNLPIDIKVTIIYPSLPSLLDRLFLIMILLEFIPESINEYTQLSKFRTSGSTYKIGTCPL